MAEALTHGGLEHNVKTHLTWIDSEVFEDENADFTRLAQSDAILVPGGFGARGSEGKINAIKFAREHEVPFLGICFGMQMAVIETARNLCGHERCRVKRIRAPQKML